MKQTYSQSLSRKQAKVREKTFLPYEILELPLL
jgi:hypothetical protein